MGPGYNPGLIVWEKTMTVSTGNALRIAGLRKYFGDTVALENISLEVPAGQVLALIGPSGCGKTTLLRSIAGLIRPDAGSIEIGEARVATEREHTPPERRGLGMVFQDYALWPHMSVSENVAFPLEMAGVGKRERRQRVEEALELVGLQKMADRAPGTLSGGQQQRVALARAVVTRPRLLLMDEPLSNLDKNLRESLALDIRRLIERLGLTAVFVTHDQHEAYALADSVAVLQEGVLAQIAPASELYQKPATPEIARFLDAGTLLEGRLTNAGFTFSGNQVYGAPVTEYRGPMTALVPRQALTLCHPEEADALARVESRLFQGEFYTLALRLGPDTSLRMQSNRDVSVGDTVGVRIDRSRLLAWDARGRALYPLAESRSPYVAAVHDRPYRYAQE